MFVILNMRSMFYFSALDYLEMLSNEYTLGFGLESGLYILNVFLILGL